MNSFISDVHRLRVEGAPDVGAGSMSKLTSCTTASSEETVEEADLYLVIYEGRVEGIEEKSDIVSSPDDLDDDGWKLYAGICGGDDDNDGDDCELI